MLNVPNGIEVTLEGIPQLFTKDKLLAMKQSGVTRISVGVQQLDDEMIKASGRTEKAEQVFNTLSWCEELSLASSVDLIFGWPRQTVEQMLKDLDAVVAAGVPHITHYELNVAGRTDFARHHRDELPSPEQNLEMYRVGAAFLQSRGSRRATAYDWEKIDSVLPPSYKYEEVFRKPFEAAGGQVVGCDAWGWGFAGVSFFLGTPNAPGWAYMNHTRIRAVFSDRLIQANSRLNGAFTTHRLTYELSLVFQELQGSPDVGLRRRLFGIDILEEFHDVCSAALQRRNWAEASSPDRIVLTGDGVFYTPLISNALAHRRMEEMRRSGALAETASPFVALGDLRRQSALDAVVDRGRAAISGFTGWWSREWVP